MTKKLRNYQVRELGCEFSIVWHDDEQRCVREGNRRFSNYADAVAEADALEEAGLTPNRDFWQVIAND